MTCPIHHHVRQPIKKPEPWESTNLSFGEDRQENIRGMVSGAPRPNEQQRVHGVKGRRLDEHRDDSLVQSTDSSWGTHGSANVPAVQDESNDDHEGEEDVERNRKRKVWKAEVHGDAAPDAAVWLRGLVDERDAHRCISEVSTMSPPVCEELRHAPTEPRYIRQGKAMIQKFME